MLECIHAVNNIKNADKILIVGYDINYDDNHINSFLREAYRRGQRMVYFAFHEKDVDYDL